jgi:hypothetical protein
MNYSSCGFDRARSRPAKIIKGAKKAAYCPRMRRSPRSLVQRLASPLFLPAATSYHEALTVAQLDKPGAACARPDEGLCHAPPRLSLLRLLPHLANLTLSVQGLRPNLWAERQGGTRRQQRTRFRRNGQRRHGQSDAQGHRARIRSRPGRRWGRKRRAGGGEGGCEGRGGGRWLSGLSAAAPEVAPVVESGSTEGGFPRRQQGRVSQAIACLSFFAATGASRCCAGLRQQRRPSWLPSPSLASSCLPSPSLLLGSAACHSPRRR